MIWNLLKIAIRYFMIIFNLYLIKLKEGAKVYLGFKESLLIGFLISLSLYSGLITTPYYNQIVWWTLFMGVICTIYQVIKGKSFINSFFVGFTAGFSLFFGLKELLPMVR
jgi:hypothetical protein